MRDREAIMSLSPRKPKELTRLLLADSALRQRMYDLVTSTDRMLEEESYNALAEFLRDNDVELGLMSHDDVTKAVSQFYREARLSGQFVRMW